MKGLVLRMEMVSAFLPTIFGNFQIKVFKILNEEVVVLQYGDIQIENELVRIHSECLTGDVFGSLKCDCREQLHRSLKAIVDNGSGMVFYLKQEGRGIGIFNKIHAYKLQEQGENTIDANIRLGLPVDARKYDNVIAILNYFDINSIRLITNNPLKINAFKNSGIKIKEIVKIKSSYNKYNLNYLNTKKELMKHTLN